VFLVSHSKEAFVRPFTQLAEVVKNGFTRHEMLSPASKTNKILMVGSVDSRKYKMARQLFESLPADNPYQIDIYGHVKDEKLAHELDQFPFVQLKGFHKQVPYAEYKLLLHTSLMENLPLVFCESIDQEVPVLAFDVGGSGEVVTQANGQLIPAYDLKAMRSSLDVVMSEKVVFSMDKSVLEAHSWDKAAQRYLLKMTGQ